MYDRYCEWCDWLWGGIKSIWINVRMFQIWNTQHSIDSEWMQDLKKKTKFLPYKMFTKRHFPLNFTFQILDDASWILKNHVYLIFPTQFLCINIYRHCKIHAIWFIHILCVYFRHFNVYLFYAPWFYLIVYVSNRKISSQHVIANTIQTWIYKINLIFRF